MNADAGTAVPFRLADWYTILLSARVGASVYVVVFTKAWSFSSDPGGVDGTRGPVRAFELQSDVDRVCSGVGNVSSDCLLGSKGGSGVPGVGLRLQEWRLGRSLGVSWCDEEQEKREAGED